MVKIDFMDVVALYLKDTPRIMTLYLGIAVSMLSITHFILFFPVYDVLYQGLDFYIFPLPLFLGLCVGFAYSYLLALLYEMKKYVSYLALVVTTILFFGLYMFGHVNWDPLLASLVGEVVHDPAASSSSSDTSKNTAQQNEEDLRISSVTTTDLSLTHQIAKWRFSEDFGYQTQSNWVTNLIYALFIGLVVGVIYENLLVQSAVEKHYFLLKRQARKRKSLLELRSSLKSKRRRAGMKPRPPVVPKAAPPPPAKPDLMSPSAVLASRLLPPPSPRQQLSKLLTPRGPTSPRTETEGDFKLEVPLRPDKTHILPEKGEDGAYLKELEKM
ncbi:unnamed protein product [Amoebophrya sp. A25]|nr:unnamed protein product [Amoebophrya sp. A25]|eukprot:GSA25T00016909001.1